MFGEVEHAIESDVADALLDVPGVGAPTEPARLARAHDQSRQQIGGRLVATSRVRVA